MQIVDIHHSLDLACFPSLESLQSRYGWDAHNHRVFERLFKLESTSLHDDLTLEEAMRYSAQKLAGANPELVGHVDLIIYCHAINDTMPFDTPVLNEIATQIFSSPAECISVTMGSCSSALMALHLLKGMGSNAPENVVILTGEKCFFSLLDYVENNGLFGEATSATWIKPNERIGLQVESLQSGMFEGIWQPIGRASKEVIADYDRAFKPNITSLVKRVIDQSGCMPQEINLVLPTHLSPFTFNRISTSVGIASERVLKQNLHKIGHCFCGDLFINTQTWLSTMPQPIEPVRILSFAAGMTGSYSAIIITKEQT